MGLATDYSFDHADLNAEMVANPSLFPEWYTRWGPIRFMPPEGLFGVEDALRARGYPEPAIAGILGGNFRRVASLSWSTESAASGRS